MSVRRDLTSPEAPADPARRQFLSTAVSAAAGVAAAAALSSCSTVEEALGQYFRELSPEELKTRLAKLELEYSARLGKPVHVSGAPALEGVLFGYGLDLSRCAGCRRCVYACVKENNQSRRSPEIHWIKVLELDKEHGVDLEHANAYYEAAEVPRPGHFYMPVACHQCRNPPCVKVCPATATWKEADGPVVIDYDWCIGCRCCIAACPYGARRFNWGEPTLPPDEANPEMHYLGNRPRVRGVAEKCTFCIQRVRRGLYPACLEVCPVGARKFGNLLDPTSEIRQVMEHRRVFIFKEEYGTKPQFYYFYGS